MTHPRVNRWPTAKEKTKIWVLATIVASLVPPFLAIIFHGVDRQQIPSLFEMFGRGDLLVIGVVITIGGFGELLPVIKRIPDDSMSGMTSAIIGGLLLILAESLWYADITSTILDNKAPPYHFTTLGSVVLFAFSAYCSARYVSIAGRAE
jgi:hypothetical protein